MFTESIAGAELTVMIIAALSLSIPFKVCET